MTGFDHWLWLLGQAWSLTVYLWPGTLVAIAGFGLAFWRVPDRSKRRFRRLAVLTAILWAVDLLVLALGGGLERAPVGPLGLEALWWLWALAAMEPLLAVLLVTRAGRGLRLRTVCLVLPPTWFLLSCYLIAAMSVTGDWI